MKATQSARRRLLLRRREARVEWLDLDRDRPEVLREELRVESFTRSRPEQRGELAYDRFAQHCHVFDIDADSWREKERKEGLDKKRALKKR